MTNNYLEFWLRYARALTAMEADAGSPHRSIEVESGSCGLGRYKAAASRKLLASCYEDDVLSKL